MFNPLPYSRHGNPHPVFSGGAQRLYADTPSGGRPLFVIRFPAIKMADFIYFDYCI